MKMSNYKKKAKTIAHATMVWEREQLQAATAAEQLTKAVAAVEQYKDELTQAQIDDVHKHVEERQADLKEFLTKARNKYVSKLAEYGIEPKLPKEKP
jgi:hypothetical protein